MAKPWKVRCARKTFVASCKDLFCALEIAEIYGNDTTITHNNSAILWKQGREVISYSTNPEKAILLVKQRVERYRNEVITRPKGKARQYPTTLADL